MSLDAATIVDHEISLLAPFATFGIMQEVVNERARQDRKWGQQNSTDGTGTDADKRWAQAAKALTDLYMKRPGGATWKMVLDEEVREAFAESDPAKLRTELLQVAAVAAAWVEAIDRREVAA